jgi:hypothetical protein
MSATFNDQGRLCKGLLSPFGLLLGPHRAALMIILNTFEAYVFLITTFLFPLLFYFFCYVMPSVLSKFKNI